MDHRAFLDRKRKKTVNSFENRRLVVKSPEGREMRGRGGNVVLIQKTPQSDPITGVVGLRTRFAPKAKEQTATWQWGR